MKYKPFIANLILLILMHVLFIYNAGTDTMGSTDPPMAASD